MNSKLFIMVIVGVALVSVITVFSFGYAMHKETLAEMNKIAVAVEQLR